jgi:uncharacterized protein (UPF0333 family)
MLKNTDFATKLYRRGANNTGLIFSFSTNRSDLIGQKVNLDLVAITRRPKNNWEGIIARERHNQDSTTLFSGSCKVSGDPIEVDLGEQPFFDFESENIESFIELKMRLPSGQNLKLVPENPISDDRKNHGSTATLIPDDKFDPLKNFAVLPKEQKLKFYATLFSLSAVMLAIVAWGVMERVWTWPTNCSGHRCMPPWMLWLFAIGGVCFFIMRAWKASLATYIDLNEQITLAITPEPQRNYPLKELIKGTTKIGLQNAQLRIVCCNRERFKYKKNTGNNQSVWTNKTQIFNTHVIHETDLPDIPPNVELGDYLPKDDLVNFDIMFERLYPQAMAGDDYGISVFWAIQIIHDDLIDLQIDVPGVNNYWPVEYFLSSGQPPES